MVQKLMVTVSILIVAILTFADLAYQTVPVSTISTVTQTIPKEYAERWTSYSPYVMTNLLTSTTSSIHTGWSMSVQQPYLGCIYGWLIPGCSMGGVYHIHYATYSLWTLQSTYLVSITVPISQNQTVTSSTTEISTISATSLVPASEALGLTDGSFSALAIVLIGALALMTLWIAFNSRHKKNRSCTQRELIQQQRSQPALLHQMW